MRRGMYTSTRTAMHVDQGTTFTLHLLVLAALRVEHPHVYGPVLGSDRGVLDIGAFAFASSVSLCHLRTSVWCDVLLCTLRHLRDAAL